MLFPCYYFGNCFDQILSLYLKITRVFLRVKTTIVMHNNNNNNNNNNNDNNTQHVHNYFSSIIIVSSHLTFAYY